MDDFYMEQYHMAVETLFTSLNFLSISVLELHV